MADEKTNIVRDEAPNQPEADRSVGSDPQAQSNVKDHIGRHLRLMYDTVASQPIPDRFLELLDQLDERKRGE